jgi:2-keto-4-pentenoate hydratase/2-oxohepta-3-ene-1,7-dioic acid hydratase in catechol pathway
MKICCYNDITRMIEGGSVIARDALAAAGAARRRDHGGSGRCAGQPPALPRPRPLAGKPVALDSARLLAPWTIRRDLGRGGNYRAHQAEMKERVGAYDRSQLSADDLMAEIFLKPAASIIGPGGTVVLPKISRHVDFECELCAVIGRTAKKVPAERALDYVYGYTMCWDISIRDPWGKGRHNTRNIRKGFDTFTGLGPWIVTRDEIRDPQDLRIHVEQNGKTVMEAHTADMINGLRDLIRFLSGVTTLKPGTLITTGTPAGVSQLATATAEGTIDSIGTME